MAWFDLFLSFYGDRSSDHLLEAQERVNEVESLVYELTAGSREACFIPYEEDE